MHAARHRLPLLAAGLAAAAGLAPSGAAAPPRTVRVTLRGSGCTLSTRTVPLGLVGFVVVDDGDGNGSFAVAGQRTRRLRPGGRAALQVLFANSGRYRYSCELSGKASPTLGDVLFVVGAPAVVKAAAAAPSQALPPALQLTQLGTFDRPVYVTAPPGEADRLFVVELTGVVRLLIDGQLQPAPFLDLSSQVKVVYERGMFSLAFAPDYATSGLFYVFYTDAVGNGNINIEEFRVSPGNPNVADPASGRVVLNIVKPWENHNGGMMEFGPDGDLYLAVGDGDSGVLHKPGFFSQPLDNLLGKILRIDPRQAGAQPYTVPSSNPFVGVAGARPEIWAYGLRNPWRFWVDHGSGDLTIADVGEGTREEIDFEPAGQGGFNFGWPCFEGTVPFDQTASCPNAVPPVYDYGHAPALCAVIGGLVLRDPRLPSLGGRFLFTDLCGGELMSLAVPGGKLAGTSNLGLKVEQPTSFGEDALGRAYVTSLKGPVYRIDPS